MYPMRALLTVLLALGVVACSGSGGGQDEAKPAPTPPIVTDARSDLLLSWNADGGPATASSVADVPAAVLAEVRVQDPTIPPEQRDPDWIFIADLRRPGADARYPVRAERREDYEATRREAQAAAARAAARQAAEAQGKPLELVPNQGSGGGPIIMYANKQCPVCQKARRWLLEEKIPYVEKDINRDRAAAQELMTKGKAQGVPVNGVPVFDVGGRLIPGFDKGAIRKTRSAVKPAAGTQGII